MKVVEKQVLRFLEGTDNNFVIPVYQRNYDWGKEQCKQLFEDLIDIINNGYRTHFMGSLVSMYDSTGMGMGRDYLIIDGQQRLTTISILLIAIHNVIKDKSINTRYADIDKIREVYLINKYANEDRKIKLKPIKNDQLAFEKILKGDEELIEKSKITLNYKYFYDLVSNNIDQIDQIYKAIESLIIVEIELMMGQDNPQLIFESLNSTGLDLTEADKVRNFILMGLKSELQEKYYEKYWNKVEENTDYEVDNFLRDYLTMKERKIHNKRKVYFAFKAYVKNSCNDIETLLKDIFKYSKYYNKLLKCTTDSMNVNNSIYKLNKLETRVLYPYLIELLDDYDMGVIKKDELEKVFEILESFIFRRVICNIPTHALNKIFMTLAKEIKRFDDYKENYLEIFKYVMLNKKASQRFPLNEELKENFAIKDVYNFNTKNKMYLLEHLENHDNKEKVMVEELVSKNELTVEHIMPQTLTAKWKKDLGEEWERVHNKYLNTIGNITLTGYNSKYSNKPFMEKKNMEHGFKDSRLYLNKYLKEVNEWNESTIKKRAELIIERAIDIWKEIETSYTSKKDNAKLFTLADDDKSFNGEKVEEINFMSEKYKVKNWTEFMERLVGGLYELDPGVLIEIMDKKHMEEKYNKRLARDPEELRTAQKIAEDLYVEVNMNTNDKLDTMRAILNEYDLELTDVEFYIK